MSVEFEGKFRDRGLEASDEPKVRDAIIRAGDASKLISYIYIYGRSFGINEQVLRICNRYMEHMVPGLTAVCMKTAIDYWNIFEGHESIVSYFLDPGKIDEWYDEVLFSHNFVKSRMDISFSDEILAKFQGLVNDNRFEDLAEI